MDSDSEKSSSEEAIGYSLLLLYKIAYTLKRGNIKNIIKYIIRNEDNLDFIPELDVETIKVNTPNNVRAFMILRTLTEDKICDINTDIDDKGNNFFIIIIYTFYIIKRTFFIVFNFHEVFLLLLGF